MFIYIVKRLLLTTPTLLGALKCGKHEVDNGRTIPWAGTFYERAFS